MIRCRIAISRSIKNGVALSPSASPDHPPPKRSSITSSAAHGRPQAQSARDQPHPDRVVSGGSAGTRLPLAIRLPFAHICAHGSPKETRVLRNAAGRVECGGLRQEGTAPEDCPWHVHGRQGHGARARRRRADADCRASTCRWRTPRPSLPRSSPSRRSRALRREAPPAPGGLRRSRRRGHRDRAGAVRS